MKQLFWPQRFGGLLFNSVLPVSESVPKPFGFGIKAGNSKNVLIMGGASGVIKTRPAALQQHPSTPTPPPLLDSHVQKDTQEKNNHKHTLTFMLANANASHTHPHVCLVMSKSKWAQRGHLSWRTCNVWKSFPCLQHGISLHFSQKLNSSVTHRF